MTEVRFYTADSRSEFAFKYAVIIAEYRGKWVFCKHRARDTYECPGGHWEPGEDIIDTARRELWEETGALEFSLRQVCPYSVFDGSAETFGMLFYAEITRFGTLPAFEIEEIELFDEGPPSWTYPLIQPQLFEKAKQISP